MRQPYLVKRLRTYLSMTLRVVPLSEFWCIFKNDLALNQPLREREREKTSHRNDFSVIPFIGWYTGLSLSGSVSDAAVRRLSPTLNNNSFFFSCLCCTHTAGRLELSIVPTRRPMPRLQPLSKRSPATMAENKRVLEGFKLTIKCSSPEGTCLKPSAYQQHQVPLAGQT